MTDQTTLDAVRRRLTVAVPPARAFDVFARETATWWPRDSHHLGATPATTVLEPFAGGRCFSRADDGTETDWGRVLVWDPPHRLLLAWLLTPEWTFEPDPARASEVEVTFAPEGEGTTAVTLVHRGFERYAEGGEAMRASVGSDGGWGGLLARYASEAGAR